MVWELLSSCWGWFWPSSSSSSNKNKYKKKKKKKALDDSSCIKLRVGWAGKGITYIYILFVAMHFYNLCLDILIDSVDLNVRAMYLYHLCSFSFYFLYIFIVYFLLLLIMQIHLFNIFFTLIKGEKKHK